MKNALISAAVALCVSVGVGSAAVPTPISNQTQTQNMQRQINTLKAQVSHLTNCFDHAVPVTVATSSDDPDNVYLIQANADDEASDNFVYLTTTSKDCV